MSSSHLKWARVISTFENSDDSIHESLQFEWQELGNILTCTVQLALYYTLKYLRFDPTSLDVVSTPLTTIEINRENMWCDQAKWVGNR